MLGRPECGDAEPERASVEGRRVLITGAGGSIGSELVSTIASCAPASLLLVDHAESSLFRVEAQRSLMGSVPITSLVADISRESDVRQLFRRHRVDVVYHAAAYKHVHLAERCCVPALRTNVLGTDYVAREAADTGAAFILISTDKAQQPVSMLGISKRLAELITSAYASEGARSTAARSGNVLGSSGSLLEVVANCIRTGDPVPVTSIEARRYFLTARELAVLLLRVTRVGQSGVTYWLNLGPEIPVGEILARVHRWAARRGYPALRLRNVGLRPGERLFEPVHLASDTPVASGVWVVQRESIAVARMSAMCRRLAEACHRHDEHTAGRIVIEAVEESNRVGGPRKMESSGGS